MKPDPLDLLMTDVLREVANPATPDSLESRIKNRSLAMNLELASAAAPSNVLHFHTLDRTAGRSMSPQSVSTAVLLNLAAMLLLAFGLHSAGKLAIPHVETLTMLESPVPAPAAPPRAKLMGGGGGQPDAAPVSQGSPPRFAAQPLNPPKAPPLAEPKIKIEPAVDVDPNLKMARTDLPNFGMTNSPLVGTSLGNGRGSGIGSGNGGGIGSGSGGSMGGGVRQVGGGVSAPEVLFAPEPEFSEEARKAKASGNVLVYLQVDVNGRPTHVRVLRGLGLGLDEKAVEAVSRYKFKPAYENGRPVPVELHVDVNFQIF